MSLVCHAEVRVESIWLHVSRIMQQGVAGQACETRHIFLLIENCVTRVYQIDLFADRLLPIRMSVSGLLNL